MKNINYYCGNGVLHSYECCATCWSRHPIAKKFEDGYFDKECRILINQDEHKIKVGLARKAGFTKKQAEYLCQGEGAYFQQVVL